MGGELILPVGYTSGGAPYGLMGEELEALLKEVKWGDPDRGVEP